MTTATVDRFHVRWRVADERRRRAVLDRMLDDALPDALRAAGLGDGEVCVRRVDVPPVVLAGDADDDTAAAQWAAGIAAAVARAVDGGEVVVFRSPHHALADMALGVARGDLTRQWAWQAAGAWPAGIASPGDALVAGVARRPAAAVSVVRSAVEAGALLALARALGWRRLAVVAVDALVAFGMDRDAAVRLVTAGAARLSDAPLGARSALVHPGDAAVTDHASAVGAAPTALVAALATAAAAEPAAVTPLAALVVLATEPSAARHADGFAAQVDAVVAEACRPAPRIEANDDAAPTGPLVGGASELGADVAVDPEPVAHTTWGGLVLCLHAVDRLDIQPSRRLLYLLGLAVLLEAKVPAERAGLPPETIDPRDPALLAFCGLSPTDDPPPPLLDDPDLADLAAAVAASLVAALPDVAPDRVLELVCRRRATITADPGWIDVRFSLDDVSVDIRRAGLDLDLGFLPWLGAVVRFSYG